MMWREIRRRISRRRRRRRSTDHVSQTPPVPGHYGQQRLQSVPVPTTWPVVLSVETWQGETIELQ